MSIFSITHGRSSRASSAPDSRRVGAAEDAPGARPTCPRCRVEFGGEALAYRDPLEGCWLITCLSCGLLQSISFDAGALADDDEPTHGGGHLRRAMDDAHVDGPAIAGKREMCDQLEAAFTREIHRVEDECEAPTHRSESLGWRRARAIVRKARP